MDTNGYSGNIVFFKFVGGCLDGRISATEDQTGSFQKCIESSDDRVFLGSVHVDCEFLDSREQEIESLESSLIKLSGEFEARKSGINSRISELRAITHQKN